MSDFIGSYLTQKGITIEGETSDEYRFNCPFHDDTVASAGFNKEKEIWRCFTCDIGGNLVDFEARHRHVSDKQAEKFISYYRESKPTVPAEEVEAKHKALIAKPELLHRLAVERNITVDVIKQFKLGWQDDRYGRLWIPIYFGEFIVNVKRWDVFYKDEKDKKEFEKRKQNKILPYKKGYSMEAIFPYSYISDHERKAFLYTEGEGDCLAAISSGIPAITVGSAGADLSNYADLFKGKSLYLAYDCDETGRRSAQSNAVKLARGGHDIKILDLSRLDAKEKEDLTDVIVKHKKGLTEIDALISQTEQFVLDQKLDDKEDTNVYPVEFNDLPKDENYNKWVKVKLILSGQEEVSKYIPRTVKFTCIGKQSRKCHYCPLQEHKECRKVDLNKNSESGINLYYGNRDTEKKDLMDYFKIQCSEFEYNVLESQIISMIFLVPLNNFQVTSKLNYICGFANEVYEDFNQIYQATAKIIRSPRNNDIIIWVQNLAPVSTMEFSIDEDFLQRHKLFQVEDLDES